MRSALVSAAVLALAAVPARGDVTVPLTGENTKVEFVGTKKDGSHSGGFKTVTGTAQAAGDPTSLKLVVEIDTNSLHSDNEKLTAHLKAPDFFNVKSHPKAKFVSTKIEKDGDHYAVTGDLTLLGKTKPVTFPATISVADGVKLESKFKLDRTQWGMTYGKGKVDDLVDLTISVHAAK